MTPATIALAVPMYRNLGAIRRCAVHAVAAIAIGAFSSVLLVVAAGKALGLPEIIYRSAMAKSATTAIAGGLAVELGNIRAVAVIASLVSGVSGMVMARFVFRVWNVRAPFAQGIALGTASHALGTAKAMEFGELQGAVSSVSLVIAGLLTCALAPLMG